MRTLDLNPHHIRHNGVKTLELMSVRGDPRFPRFVEARNLLASRVEPLQWGGLGVALITACHTLQVFVLGKRSRGRVLDPH
jgi:hypothetical protein